MENFKIHYNFWLLPKTYLCCMLFGHFFFNISEEEGKKYLSTYNGQVTLNHERIHILQAETFKTKYFGFYCYYIWYWIKNLFKYKFNSEKAYYNIPFEKEAYDYEFEFDFTESDWREYC